MDEVPEQSGIKDFLYFAVRPEDLNTLFNEQYFTIAITGVYHNDKVLASKNPDHLTPCPSTCPIEGL